MSDEYAASGFKGSLVNPTFTEMPNKKQKGKNGGSAPGQPDVQRNFDYQTHNYPASGDSTAEGGYGSSSNVWSGHAQRGNKTGTGTYQDRLQAKGATLTDQGKDGDPLRDQFDDYGDTDMRIL